MAVTERRAGGVPWAGVVVTALSLAATVAISFAVYDSLPELVTTREPRPGRMGSQVPRIVLVAAVPLTLVLLGTLMVGRALVADRLRRLVPAALVPRRRSADLFLVVLPPFFAVVHGGVLLRTAGHAFPLEVTVAVAFGLLIAGLSRARPLLDPLRFVPGVEQARRLGGHGLVAVGGCCAVGAFFLPPMFVAVAAAFAAGAISLLMVLVPLSRLRS
ncbi:hypothetical protein HCN51_48895 [Nonomuraea sp. FMUSA5-5]|uniref:DUF1648 domain-containing protein n=1 Tax=Nonomuraea composti TaxID=2720023 RepID=A0ABX1BHP9_9ACTN|nr:hypothetical protein [Nonomuraea sp. FMUSA5-5]NJP97260.1 hypothetical protein [Nonomuraea sp. FMUSA5-5]